jgi:NAD(P)-dependent dehydrogenase (short-subunit alcohol dehydrogenase family)
MLVLHLLLASTNVDGNFHSELTHAGAGSGIGRAVVLRLVADGIKNIALIDLNEAHIEGVETEITGIDPSVKVLKIGTDCSKEDQVESAVEKAVATFGRLDACFNGAGIGGSGSKTADMGSDNLDAVLGVNLKGVWYCERAQVSFGDETPVPISDCLMDSVQTLSLFSSNNV